VIQIAPSIGIAVFENKDSADDLIKKADSAMYLSKSCDQRYMLYVPGQ
jgi:GGDEF domain-containing protein